MNLTDKSLFALVVIAFILLPRFVSCQPWQAASPNSFNLPDTVSEDAANTHGTWSEVMVNPDPTIYELNVPAALDDTPPDRDLVDLARRYRFGEAPEVRLEYMGHSSLPKAVGFIEKFIAVNPKTAESYELEAELVLVSQNTYWYVDRSIDLTEGVFNDAAVKWEEKIRPQLVRVFGDINSPGLDGDPRLTVLNTSLEGAAGYFSSQDTHPRWVHPSSNEREMIFMDPLKLSPDSAEYLSVLAHEFQHVVHDNWDKGEDSWVNEGLSEVAATVAGFQSPFIRHFLSKPSASLVNWPDELAMTPFNYGAAALFFLFAAGRNGGLDSLSELVVIQKDGIEGVDEWLKDKGSSFKSEFKDWVVANYLDIESGRYSYPVTVRNRVFHIAKIDTSTYEVAQFGSRYFELPIPDVDEVEPIKFWFDGNEKVDQLARNCESKCWWSNRGDSINTSLTLKLVLNGENDLNATFDMAYDIEENWDYVYMSVSSDGGETWQTLEGEQTTDFNPSGSSYGHGYTGSSDWRNFSVDLGKFSHEEVLVRFEYVTDDAVNLDGMVLGKFEIPETGISLEAGDEAWVSSGFVLIGEPIDQLFIVRIVETLADGGFQIREVKLDEQNMGYFEVRHRDGQQIEKATLIVAGATENSTQPGIFKILAGFSDR